MSERCDYSDLPVASCAHCQGVRGLTEAPETFVALSLHGSRIEARYPGRCGHCERSYGPGEYLTLAQPAHASGDGSEAVWCLSEHVQAVA